jgi:hypothetical protein
MRHRASSWPRLEWVEAAGPRSAAVYSGDRFDVFVARLAADYIALLAGHVATAMAIDHAGDCGVFNVGTLESAGRRGVATAITNRLLHAATIRGCVTASLQATES